MKGKVKVEGIEVKGIKVKGIKVKGIKVKGIKVEGIKVKSRGACGTQGVLSLRGFKGAAGPLENPSKVKGWLLFLACCWVGVVAAECHSGVSLDSYKGNNVRVR